MYRAAGVACGGHRPGQSLGGAAARATLVGAFQDHDVPTWYLVRAGEQRRGRVGRGTSPLGTFYGRMPRTAGLRSGLFARTPILWMMQQESGESGGDADAGTGPDQGRDTPTASTELMRAIRTGPIELAIKLALRDCGLSLARVQYRLARHGPRVSTSTLSNWKTGRSRPERSDSIRALRGLEQLLELPRDSLLRLVGPRRPRGRWTGHVPGSVRYDALFDDYARLAAILDEVNDADDQRCLALSIQDRVMLDHDRRFRLIRVQEVITALAEGVDSRVVFFHAEDGPVPEIAAPDGVRIGRRRSDPAAGIAVAEVLLDCRLDRGDVFLVEYEFRFAAAAKSVDYYYRALRNPCRQYLLRVGFDPAAVPVRCFGFRAPRVGAPFADSAPVHCQRGRPAHLYAADNAAGIIGIRWEWQ